MSEAGSKDKLRVTRRKQRNRSILCGPQGKKQHGTSINCRWSMWLKQRKHDVGEDGDEQGSEQIAPYKLLQDFYLYLKKNRKLLTCFKERWHHQITLPLAR